MCLTVASNVLHFDSLTFLFSLMEMLPGHQSSQVGALKNTFLLSNTIKNDNISLALLSCLTVKKIFKESYGLDLQGLLILIHKGKW